MNQIIEALKIADSVCRYYKNDDRNHKAIKEALAHAENLFSERPIPESGMREALEDLVAIDDGDNPALYGYEALFEAGRKALRTHSADKEKG